MGDVDPNNPYAAPEAATQPDSGHPFGFEGSAPWIGPRSVWLMILLTIVTAGLYINYWVHRQALVLNKTLDRNHIQMGVVYLFWILALASLFWIIPETLQEDAEDVVWIGTMLTRADGIFALFMAFVIRSRLNMLFRMTPGQRGWHHGLWTFLFGAFYLQWKINRNLRAGSIAPHAPHGEDKPSFDFLQADEGASSPPETSRGSAFGD